MRITPTCQFLSIAAASFLTSAAHGAVLWTTTFTGTDETSRNLVNTVGVGSGFTDALSGSSANLTFSDTTFTVGSAFVNVAARTQFSPNTNVDNPNAGGQNGGSWQSEFRYTGGTQTISLDSVTFDITRTGSAGTVSTADSLLRQVILTAEYSINGGANWLSIAAAKTVDVSAYNTTTPNDLVQTYNFSSPLLVDNASSADLWIRFKAENTLETTGAYVNIRDIKFEGTAVPEPSAAILGGLGLLGLLRRKRA